MSTAIRLTLPEIEERVCDVASEQLGLVRQKVSPQLSFLEDLGCDSLDMVELLMTIEESSASRCRGKPQIPFTRQCSLANRSESPISQNLSISSRGRGRPNAKDGVVELFNRRRSTQRLSPT